MRQLGLQAQFALVLELEVRRQLLEVEQLERVARSTCPSKLIDLLLPIDLRQLLPLDVLAPVVHVLEPLRRRHLQVIAERVTGNQRLEQRIGEQRAERLLAELATGKRHGGLRELAGAIALS